MAADSIQKTAAVYTFETEQQHQQIHTTHYRTNYQMSH